MPTILIVEDHPVVREGLTSLFTRAGYDVMAGQDGEEGFALAREHRPHVIVSDLAMTREDGLNFLKRLRHDNDLMEVPFVLLTARHAGVYAEVCRRAGADAFVEKVDPDEVLAVVVGLFSPA